MTIARETAFLRRVVAEHRGVVIALGVVLLLNIVVFAFVVFPLSRRVGSVAERTRAAEMDLMAARAQHDLASATLTGKARAAEELETFYTKVLPGDLASARGMAFPRLSQLARESNLQVVSTRPAIEADSQHTLTRLQISMELAGTYAAIRRFVDRLERVPEFVVVDDVRLSESARGNELTVRLELSTYYRDGAE